jgi:hypothetical protein
LNYRPNSRANRSPGAAPAGTRCFRLGVLIFQLLMGGSRNRTLVAAGDLLIDRNMSGGFMSAVVHQRFVVAELGVGAGGGGRVGVCSSGLGEPLPGRQALIARSATTLLQPPAPPPLPDLPAAVIREHRPDRRAPARPAGRGHRRKQLGSPSRWGWGPDRPPSNRLRTPQALTASRLGEPQPTRLLPGCRRPTRGSAQTSFRCAQPARQPRPRPSPTRPPPA